MKIKSKEANEQKKKIKTKKAEMIVDVDNTSWMDHEFMILEGEIAREKKQSVESKIFVHIQQYSIHVESVPSIASLNITEHTAYTLRSLHNFIQLFSLLRLHKYTLHQSGAYICHFWLWIEQREHSHLSFIITDNRKK